MNQRILTFLQIFLYVCLFAIFTINCNSDKDKKSGDSTAPTATASPSSGTISGTQAITIIFTETISQNSLTLGETMASEATTTWSNSQTKAVDDTLRISPSTTWTGGAGTLTIDCTDAAGNALETLSLSFTIDATSPTGNAVPDDGTTISPSQAIVITFNEAIDTSTLVLTGSMGTASDGGDWGGTTDTLTVSPAASTPWSDGAQVLIIDCDDTYGNNLATVTLNYTVEAIAITSGASHSSIVLDSNLTGNIRGKDLPTISYDTANEVYNSIFLSGLISKRKPPRSSALLNRGLTPTQSDNIIDVASSFGGSSQVSITSGEDFRIGNIEFVNFVARQGFPAFDSGILEFDLTTTETTINGTLLSTDLSIGGKEIKIRAVYDLYLENTLWRGTMSGEIVIDNQYNSFDYDYDTPIISDMQVVPLDVSNEETTGDIIDGGKVRVKLFVNSNAPVNWVNTIWNSPDTNLIGGGSSQSYCAVGTCGAIAAGQFREETKGYWIWYYDYTINEYQPSGIYTWEKSVKNSAQLSSRDSQGTQNVENSSASGPPTIHSASLETADLTDGGSSTVTLHLVSNSIAPANWINLSLDGPASNLEGGGSGTTFADCTTYTDTGGHPCNGLSTDYWYYTRTWNFSEWAENGAYAFNNVSVMNAADLTSENADSLDFTLENNLDPGTPNISSIDVMHYITGEDPVTEGTSVNGQCIQTGPLEEPMMRLALVITSDNSNAPVDWLNISFQGPAGNLIGGGSGMSYTDLTGGQWRMVWTYSLDSPNDFAPKGTYYWENISVQNEGMKVSSTYSGSLTFDLSDSCF